MSSERAETDADGTDLLDSVIGYDRDARHKDTAGDDDDPDAHAVYKSVSEPYIGETVVLTTEDRRIGGRVRKAVVHNEGDAPIVYIQRPDGEQATVPWSLVEQVDGRTSVHTHGCPGCGSISDKTYRCTECGKDLANSSPTIGRYGGR